MILGIADYGKGMEKGRPIMGAYVSLEYGHDSFFYGIGKGLFVLIEHNGFCPQMIV